MGELELRLLNPQTDVDLFREAYGWRQTKRHVQPDRAPFEAFIADDPRQTVIGVFNDQFIAAYLIYEWQPEYFECHFTSRRGTPKDILIQAGRAIRDAFLQNGAIELCAWITERNRALATYLEALEFRPDTEKEFAGQSDTQSDRLSAESESPTRMFIRYAVRGESPSG